MKFKISSLLIVALLLMCAMSAYCVETYDPNAGSAISDAPASTDALSSDGRLSTKITYSIKKTAVRKAVEDLGKAAGVTLRAGSSSKDWQVRDRKINLFAKETPLRDIMNAMARVTGFKWSVEGTESKPSYRLVWDANSKQQAAAIKEQVRQLEEQQMVAMRQQGLDAVKDLDNLSADDMARLRAENPFLFWMAASGMSKNFNGFMNNAPDISKAMVSGSSLSMKGSDLNAAAQASLAGLIGSVNGLESKFGGGKASETPPNIADATITINAPGGRGGRRFGRMLGGVGVITVRTENGRTTLPMFNPNSPMAKSVGKMLIEADLLNRPIADVFAETRSDFGNAMRQNRNQAQSAATNRGGVLTTTVDGQYVITQASDPILDAKFEGKLDGKTLEDVQEQLASAAGIAIVSDNFPSGRGFGDRMGRGGARGGDIDTQNADLRTVLNNVSENFDYSWTKYAAPVEFQDSEWFEKIETLIPDELLEGWKSTLKKTGGLELADLAQMATLTQQQFQANIGAEEELSGLNLQRSVMQNRNILMLLGSLNKSQLAAAYSARGLNLKSLDPGMQTLRSALGAGASALDNPEVPAAMKITRDAAGSSVNVSVTTSADPNDKTTWNIALPKK